MDIYFAIGTFVSVFLLLYSCREESGVALLSSLMLFVTCVIALTSHQDRYKEGQIDAINGKIKYEQIETKQWKLKENE